MDPSQKRLTTYAVAAVVILFILFVVCRLALREPSTLTQQEPPKAEPTKSLSRHSFPDFEVSDDQPTEAAPVNQSEISTVTNAAMIYRQAFALYDALSKDEKGLLVDWRTNVDSSVEAELCAKMRPICDIMHQAATVTNCDWGIEPMSYETTLPHLAPARGIARAAIWNAAHCRQEDWPGAAEDVLSTLQLGRSVSSSALIGSLVDVAIQGIAESYVAANVGLFRDAEGKRLATSLSNLIYEEEPSRAMEQEASLSERYTATVPTLSQDEFEKSVAQLFGGNAPTADRAAFVAAFRQVTESQRALAKALASGSTDEYEAWQGDFENLRESNPLAQGFLAPYDKVMDKWQLAAVRRDMTVAALAVAQEGPSVLSSHLDPSTDQPFVYTETSEGFELQSGFKTNGIPLKMQFK